MTILVMFGSLVTPLALAQETTPDETPTEQPTPTPESDVTTTNTDTTTETNTGSEANTGGNEPSSTPFVTPDDADPEESTESVDQVEETETPTPTDVQTATDSALLVENDASVSGSIQTNTNTGSNSVTSNGNGSSGGGSSGSQSSGSTSTPTPTPTTVTLSTGDSVAVTVLDNNVNSTEVNAEVVYHTINLYANESGTIDLSLPSELAAILIAQQPNDEEIHALFSVQSNATVTNNVTIDSNTGANSATGDDTVTITTGDAIALLSLLNRINFLMVDSVLHVAVINIFGTFTGNILLPDLLAGLSTTCETCGGVSVDNTAEVTTNATLTADTGNNTVTASDGTVTTGNATAAVQLFDFVNTLIYGSQHAALYIHNFGTWNGQFLGWADGTGGVSEELVVPFGTCDSCYDGISAANHANVTNNIQMSAITGGNTVAASGAGSIETGNAFVLANIINFVNTTLIRSFGFFGFINIFGTWNGDIGSKSLFPEDPVPAIGGARVQNQNDSSSQREQGGLLTVTTSNNVAAYVLPGDTVTLFANIKNPGSGAVYDAKMIIMLIQDKKEVNTMVTSIGNLAAGKGIKFSSGLVLSKSALKGNYAIRVAAYGYTGPDNTKVSAWGESYFTIQTGATGGADTESQFTEPVAEQEPAVLGRTTTSPNPFNPNILLALLVLLLLIPEYILFRALKDKELVRVILAPTVPAFARLRALHLLLL